MDFTLPPAIEEAVGAPGNSSKTRCCRSKTIRPTMTTTRTSLWRRCGVTGEGQGGGPLGTQMPTERGGMGLPTIGMAAVYEEMNRSIFGPVAINCAAPDDGNMFVLNRVGTEEQKTKWLQPIIDGDIHSSFVMTEPHPAPAPTLDDADQGRADRQFQMANYRAQVVYHRRRKRDAFHFDGAHLRRRA